MAKVENKSTWTQSLVYTNQSKRAVRPATPKGVSWEQIGVDGSIEGGKRPHPGMKWFTDLTGNLGTYAQGIQDFFPVTFRIASTKYAYGFVYRVKKDSNSECKYFLEFRIGDSTTFQGPIDLRGLQGNGDKQMNVTVYGRFVYVFVSGSEPFFFYINEDPVNTFTLVVKTDTGPGATPEVVTQDSHVGATSSTGYDEDFVFETTDFFTSPPATGRARFLHYVFWPDTVTQTDPPDGLNYNISNGVILGATGPNTKGPSDLLGGQLVQDDPTFMDLDPAGYPTGVQYLRNGGAEDAPTPIITSAAGWSLVNPENNKIYAYAYAYMLYDSRTGKKSAPSEKFIHAQGPKGAFSPWLNGSGSITKYGQQLGWGMIDVLYPENTYDTILMYRSLAIGYKPSSDDLPNPDQFLMKLDSIRTLNDYDIATPTPPTGFKRSVILYHLANEQLVTQDDLVEDSFLEEMPTGGSSLFYERTMLVGKTGAMNEELGGLGTFWWSNLLAPSVELFAASDKYLMTMPDEEVERFCYLSPNVLALTRQGLYLVRRETTFLKAFPIAQGYGVTGPRAACTVGSNVYYMSGQGLRVIDSDGALSDVESLNKLIQDDWKADLASIELAFDPSAKCIYVLNPIQKHLVILWMQTGQVTELYDCPMKHVTEGNCPFVDDATDFVLEARALFVQAVDTAGDDSGWRWRVYTADYGRQKENIQTLDPTGTMLFTASENFSSGSTFTASTAGFGTRLEGCKLYALSGARAGESATILNRLSSTVLALDPDDVANLHGLQTGDRMGISPVYFRWVGHQLGIEDDNGQAFGSDTDYFLVRQAEGLSCAFVDVDPNGVVVGTDDKDARFRGLLYRGSEEEPKVAEFPVNTDGSKCESIAEGASTVYAPMSPDSDPDLDGAGGRYGYSATTLFPGVEVFVPGLDFRLLSVSVEGTIKDRNT